MKNTILVVDDDENVLDILRQSLSSEGYVVHTASEGKEALSGFKDWNPDMVVLDMMLPDIDGREVLKRIRKMEDEGSTPVLFLSADSDLETRLTGLDEGAEDYIVKPFALEELKKKIDRALERSRKTKELEAEKKALETEVNLEQQNYAKLNRELKKQLLSIKTLFSLSQDLNRQLDMDELINLFALTIVGELKISSMALFTSIGEKSDVFMLRGAKGFDKSKLADLEIDTNGSFIAWLTKWRKPRKIVRTRDRRWVHKLPDLRLAIFEYATPVIVRKKIRGVVFTGPKISHKDYTPFDLDILFSICNSVGIGMENARLFNKLQNTYLSTVKTLVSIIEAKDAYTKGHTERVAAYATAIAEKMDLSKEDKRLIAFGAVLHDIGKLGVYETVLNKTGDLSEEEWSILRGHPEVGAKILKNMEFLAGTVELVRHHHESYDGKGYPDHLKGEEIPLGARIITVADSFDAMTTDRSYRKALSREEAMGILKAKSGSQFDPVVVENFLELLRAGFMAPITEKIPTEIKESVNSVGKR